MIENEIKYILDHKKLEESKFTNWKKLEIRQGYIDGIRIRQMNDDYIFTYKKWIKEDGKKLQIEIETPIDKITFDRLWKKVARSLTKTRYMKKVNYKEGEVEWVVDFLKDKDKNIYFTLAESEMPENMQKPPKIENKVAEHLLYEVEHGDKSFSNRKLSQKKYAKKMLDFLKTSKCQP